MYENSESFSIVLESSDFLFTFGNPAIVNVEDNDNGL